MGDDMPDMGVAKVFIGDQEIGEVKDFLPTVNADLTDVEHIHTPLIAIQPSPGSVPCTMTLSPIRRPRWRMIQRAYKIMRTDVFGRIRENAIRQPGTTVEIEAHTSMGKSEQPVNIRAITLPEGGKENETLLHIASIHGK